MILKNTDIQRFNELMQNRKIVCFGSGRILDKFFSICPLANNIECIIDNDQSKWNTTRKVSNYNKNIVSPVDILSLLKGDKILLVTAGAIAGREIIHQLENMGIEEDQEVFWSFFILNEDKTLQLQHKRELPSNLRLSKNQLIPKIIHYCWVGNNKIPAEHQKYIENWKRLCPDYKIICWNEKNYDIEKNKYMKQAYEAKAWGFVPDYMRKDILYQYGGIYLDTDVEMLKCPDELLYQDGFCGIENGRLGIQINMGLGFGARKGLPLIKELRDVYSDEEFHLFERNRMKIGPDYETEVLKRHGFQANNEYQIVANMTVYPIEVLSGTRFYSGRSFVTKNTYFVHHYASSWNDKKYSQDKEDVKQLYKIFKCI